MWCRLLERTIIRHSHVLLCVQGAQKLTVATLLAWTLALRNATAFSTLYYQGTLLVCNAFVDTDFVGVAWNQLTSLLHVIR